MVLVSSTYVALAIAFLVVASVTAVVSVAAATSFLVTNRRERLARNESIRSYYGFALTH